MKYFEGQDPSTNMLPINTFMHLGENLLGFLGCQISEKWLGKRLMIYAFVNYIISCLMILNFSGHYGINQEYLISFIA